MHNIYMNQPGQTAPTQYQAMPGAATGEEVTNRNSFKAGKVFSQKTFT